MMISPFVKLRAEFKALLSTLSLSLEFSKNELHKRIQVVVEPKTITIENGENRFIFELQGLTLVPNSCRGLRWSHPRELQLALEVKENPHKDGSVNLNGIIPNAASSNEAILVSRIQASQNSCQCVGCGMQLFKCHNKFKRVLPLPSENWSDFADIWFCHNHSHTSTDSSHPSSGMDCSGDNSIEESVSKLKSFPMLPRFDDCLVSSLYMLVNSSNIKSGSLVHSAGRLLCKRCSNFIGFVKEERNRIEQNNVVYKLYHHAVSFKQPGCQSSHLNEQDQTQEPLVFHCNDNQQHIEDFMCCLLKDQSKMFTSFRFILTSSLQAKDQSCISVLIWLLDQELNILSGQLPGQSNESKVKVSTDKYIKMLYKATFTTLGETKSASLTKASNVFEAWRIDNTVHGISLPYPLCKQLIHLLVTSTKRLAKSQRSLNGFHVGFLKLS